MSAPSSSMAGGSPMLSVPTRATGAYSSPLRLDGPTRTSTGVPSPWMHPTDPGSPLDDSRSIASSARSSRRRRGGPDPAQAAGEGKELSQAFQDLERMQQENKERMHGSVRSGRSSPGDDLFMRSGSMSSCRSSVRRRRWAAPSATSAAEASPLTVVREEKFDDAAAPSSDPVRAHVVWPDGTAPAQSHATPSAVLHPIASPDAAATKAPTAGAAAVDDDNASAARASSPLAASNFSPVEGDGGEAQSALKPRLSGLPIWLKRRPTANTPKKPTDGVATPEPPFSAEEAPLEKKDLEVVAAPPVTAAPPITTPQPHAMLSSVQPKSEEKPAATTGAAEVAARAPAENGSTSPIRKARNASSMEKSAERMRRSPLPGPRHDAPAPAHASTSTAAAAADSQGSRSGAPAASPLMQNYLARHTRAAAAALAASGTAPEESSAHVDPALGGGDASPAHAEAPSVLSPVVVVAVDHSSFLTEAEEAPNAPPAVSANTSFSSLMAGKKGHAVQLAATIEVDFDNPTESETTNVTGAQSTLQTSNTAFPRVKATEPVGAGKRKSSGDASASESVDAKPKRMARVVRQDLSVKKPAQDHAAHAQNDTVTEADRGLSVSRARPSGSYARDYPTVSVGRESRESSYMRSESSVTRTSRPRRSSVVQPTRATPHPPGTAESSVARYSRERSGTESYPRASRPALEKTVDGASGNLQKSTALFEMRRQQVLQDRQERERKAAAEERARLGPVGHGPTTKKKTLTPTTSLQSSTQSREKAAVEPQASSAAQQQNTADLDGALTVKAIRRPASSVSTTSAAASPVANGRLRTAAYENAGGERRPVASGAANASTTTVVASPTVAANVAHSPAAGASEPTQSVATAVEGTRAAAAHPAKATATPSLLQPRRPVIHTTSLNPTMVAPSPSSSSAAVTPASSPSAAARGRAENRAGTATTATAAADNHLSPPPARSGAAAGAKTTLAPFATRAPLHRTGVPTRREAAAPGPAAGAAPTAASPYATSTGATGLRRAERRVNAKLTTLTTVKSHNPGGSISDSSTKASAAASEGSATVAATATASPAVHLAHSSPPTPSPQAPAAAVVVEAPPVAAAAAAALSPEPRPAPFCVECGQRHVDDAAKFCAVCGHKRIFLS